jgi:hypothetical protein
MEQKEIRLNLKTPVEASVKTRGITLEPCRECLGNIKYNEDGIRENCPRCLGTGYEKAEETCVTCRFCRDLRRIDGRTIECRRRAPAIGNLGQFGTRWPRVTEFELCGEWELATKGDKNER